jgi:hypothetical protein
MSMSASVRDGGRQFGVIVHIWHGNCANAGEGSKTGQYTRLGPRVSRTRASGHRGRRRRRIKHRSSRERARCHTDARILLVHRRIFTFLSPFACPDTLALLVPLAKLVRAIPTIPAPLALVSFLARSAHRTARPANSQRKTLHMPHARRHRCTTRMIPPYARLDLLRRRLYGKGRGRRLWKGVRSGYGCCWWGFGERWGSRGGKEPSGEVRGPEGAVFREGGRSWGCDVGKDRCCLGTANQRCGVEKANEEKKARPRASGPADAWRGGTWRLRASGDCVPSDASRGSSGGGTPACALV